MVPQLHHTLAPAQQGLVDMSSEKDVQQLSLNDGVADQPPCKPVPVATKVRVREREG